MSLHVAVVAHVARTEQAKRLADDLGAELFMDDGSLGEWANHRRALAWGAERDGHLCVMQDDALPIPDFTRHAERAIAERPDDMLGLYVGKGPLSVKSVEWAVHKADTAGAAWITYKRLGWGVAMIVPCHTIPALLDWCDDRDTPYDIRIGRAWQHTQGRPVHHCWPSLVDHRDEPSVIEGRNPRKPGRVAWRVGVPNWSGGTVAM